MLIRIATAECFTHGKIGAEIHALSRGYPLTYPWTVHMETLQLSLVAGLFIPTLSGVRSLLGIIPLVPVITIDDIKVYNQEQDIEMAFQMAAAIKKITQAHIGIGTTAGIGKGGVALVFDKGKILDTTDWYADLRTSPYPDIKKRQESGINKTLHHLENVLSHFS